jgi:hypothetical protein
MWWLGEQPRLAHAGLAGDERHRRTTVGGVRKRRFEHGQLGGAADQPGTGDAYGHGENARRSVTDEGTRLARHRIADERPRSWDGRRRS